jgi:uncharacterized protein (TIGR03435 family)
MRKIVVCMGMAALAWAALGQEFEAVSVKPNKSGSNGSHSKSDPGMLTATNTNLRSLILLAYHLKDYQLEGPDWLGTERFDVAAKFPEALPQDPEKYNAALGAMMQKMLADRFKLAVHRAQKMFAVYGLIVEKSGIKFKEGADCESRGQSSNSDNNHYSGTCVSMDTFASSLARRMDLPVVDMSGLKGRYDVTLDWVPEPRQGADGKSDAPATDAPSGPSLPLALQEKLGLKLEARKTPIEILIVDHAEKVPTEN